MTTHSPTISFSCIDCLDIDVPVRVAVFTIVGLPVKAAWAGDVEVLAPASLLALINHFKGTQVLSRPVAMLAEDDGRVLDLRDIKGQESAKRALEVTAAGSHNLLMLWPITQTLEAA